MSVGERVSIGVVDDDAHARDTIHDVLWKAGYFSEQFESAHDFLAVDNLERFHCAIIDVRLQGMDGVELLRAIHDKGVRIPVIVMTGYPDVDVAVEAFRANAADFLQKPIDYVKLVKSVDTIVRDEIEQRRSNQDARLYLRRLTLLTKREREVLDLLIAGHLSSKEIAQQLGISHRTADVHRTAIMRKMEARTASELVRIAALASQI